MFHGNKILLADEISNPPSRRRNWGKGGAKPRRNGSDWLAWRDGLRDQELSEWSVCRPEKVINANLVPDAESRPSWRVSALSVAESACIFTRGSYSGWIQ